MFGSGRVPQTQYDAARTCDAVIKSGMDASGLGSQRLNTADIILAAVAQSGGKLRFEDFTPLPCGDPNCATIGYLLKVGAEVGSSRCDDRTAQRAVPTIRSVSDFIDFMRVKEFLVTK